MWGDISQRTGTIATDMSVDAVRAVRRERGCAGWFVNNDLRTGTFRFIGTGPQNLWRASSIGPRTTPMARVAPTRLHSPAHLGRASRGRYGAQLARRGVPVRARAGDDTAGESTSTSTSRFSLTPGSAPPSSALGRREALGSVAALTAGLVCLTPPDARALVEEVASARPKVPDYTARGSYGVKRLPKLEHTCVSCFPRCVGDACLLSIDAYVPTPPAVLPDAMFPVGGGKVAPDGDGDGDKLRDRSRGPYPLAVFTSGTAFPNHHVPPA